MGKNILLSIFVCMLLVCSSGYNNAFGKGIYYPDVTDASLMWDYKPYEVDPINGNYPNGCPFPAPASLHAFVWGQWPDWSTYNDWTTVDSGNSDSDDHWTLTTDIDILADSLPHGIGDPVPNTNVVNLCWYSPIQIVSRYGTFAGYRWTVPQTGPGSDQIIVGAHISHGRYNYPTGTVAPAIWELQDGDGNVLWAHVPPIDWINNNFAPNATSYWPDNSTKSIQIVLHVDLNYQPHWIWPGNSAYLGEIALFTIDDIPRCGDALYPYPTGDFNKDCVVDYYDFAQFSLAWLQCNDPQNEECRAVPQQKIEGESFVLAGTQTSKFWFDKIVPGTVQASSDYTNGLGTTYVEGDDYIIDYEQGTVARTATSAIPDYSTHPEYGVSEFFNITSNHPYFVWFDYATKSTDTAIQKTSSQHEYLQNSRNTISHGGSLKMICYGDSISWGGEVSLTQWLYSERFHRYLKDIYPSANITNVNKAQGGWTTVDGLANLNERILTQNPDLVLLAFGMNDHSGIPVATYKANLKSICQQINAIGAEVIVLSSCPPNKEWAHGLEMMDQYAAAAGEAALETGNAFADVYTVWMRAMQRKDYNLGEESMLGNNVNHPNNFGHWIYLKALEEIW